MLKGIYGILIGMLIVLLVMYGNLTFNSKVKTQEEAEVENPKYHLQLIIQNTNENFWTSFEKGAHTAQEEYGVYIEFVTLEQMDVDNLREAVEMGVNSGIDGIALQAADSEQTLLMIEDAKEQGVAILSYENNSNIISETPMVGTNSYSLGNYAGNMAVEASKGQAEVAVVINSAGNSGDEVYNSLIIEGIKNSFGAYGTMNLRDSNIYTINTEMFEAEKVASAIINSKDRPDLIICMDEKCTPGIAQILVDNNMVGDIKLVGYGITAKTLDYIDHGVIYGTICPDAYEIGYDTVKQLIQSLEGEQISDKVSTGLYTIDKSNVRQYLESMEED
jgi:ribose transport system substrate-binding protein